jgi:hypothetical protein
MFLLQYINNQNKTNTNTETADGTRYAHFNAEFIISVCCVQSFSLRTLNNDKLYHSLL